MFVLDLFNTKYEKALRAGAVDQVVSEGGPYDLPGKDYPRPGDAPRRPRPSGSTTSRRHDDDPDFMDPDQRRLRAEQERLKKAWAEKNKGMVEEYTRGAWKDEALDYKDFADLAYEKLTGAYGDKRRGIAQHYSRLENRTFGSTINQHGYTQLLIDLYKKANRDFTNPQDDTDTLSGTGFGHVSQREQGMAEGAPISGDGGAVDNFRQQMANNTELAYQKGMAEARKKKKKKSSRSMQGYFFPGYGYYGGGDSGEGGGGDGGESVNEFAAGGGGGSGDYFQALASAWYNGAFDTGSLQKGIKSKEDVERLLNRGIIGPDGVTRKYAIDYNSTFEGVVISSDDYYEHSDYNDQGQEVDSRNGRPWGPYDYMEFDDEELDESANWRDPKYKGQLYTQEPPDYNDTREYDNARFNPKPKGYPGRKELPGGGEYNRTDPLRRGQGIGRSGIKNNINLSGKRKGLPSRDQITSLKGSIKDAHGTHTRPNLPEQGEVTKTATGLKHRATDKYGAGNDEPHHYTGGRSGFSDPGKYARDLEHVNKQLVKNLDASMGISWKNRGTKGVEVDEQGVVEKIGDLRPKLGSRRDQGKSVRKWRQARGMDESGMAEASNELATMTTMGMGNPLDFSSDYALYTVQKGRELFGTMRKLYARADSLPPAERSKFYQRLDALAYEGLGDEILRYSKTLTVDDLIAISDVLENYDVMFNTIAIPDELQDAEAAWKQYAAEVALARTQAQPGQTMHERSTAEGAAISGDGGAVANFKQQMANNTELAYQKAQQGVAEGGSRYDDNRTGFGKRSREDDEYHVPDPVETQYNIKVNGQVINRQPFANRAAAVAWAKQAVASGKLDLKTATLSPINQVNELSTDKLAQYKKAAGIDASAADKRGDYERGNKRFKGIVKATIKQGNNDLKKHGQQGMAEGYQLDEGAVETITALVKKIPGIGKYYQMAQQYKPQLIEILKTSKSGKEVKQKMEQLAAGQSATVAESGMMKQLGGLAVGGGSILSTMWMNAMGMIDGVLAHAAAGEVGGAVASGSILGLIPVTLMLFAAMLLFKGSKQSSDEKAQAFQAQRGQQGMSEGSSTASEAVERAILNRIMVAHTDLLMRFGPDKVMQAAEEVAYNVGDVDEIGTSDVSAYVNQVKQILGA